MARTVRNPKLDTRSARLKLVERREPYWTVVSAGCAIGYRRGTKGGTWIARLRVFCRCDNPENRPSNHHIQATNKLRLQYLAARRHDLGPKPLFHFLDEVERGADMRSQLEKYARLPAEFIKAYGGDKFQPALHSLDGARP